MYALTGNDSVRKLEEAPPPSDLSSPSVLCHGGDLVVAYHPSQEWKFGADARTVRLVFKSPLATYVGHPNDEALSGHPLFTRGLRPMGVFEVVDSSWVRDIEHRNSGHPRHRQGLFAEFRHFVLTFEDEVVEVIARRIDIEIVDFDPRSAILACL